MKMNKSYNRVGCTALTGGFFYSRSHMIQRCRCTEDVGDMQLYYYLFHN